jgi:GxxExxY protein
MDEPSAAHNEITGQIVDAAFAIHTSLGPGLLESVCEQCLAYELKSRTLNVTRQVQVPIRYRELIVDAAFRIDMLVNECVVVEVKAVEKLLPIHDAQVLTYLKLTGHRVGLLVNFNVPRIKEGIRRLAS